MGLVWLSVWSSGCLGWFLGQTWDSHDSHFNGGDFHENSHQVGQDGLDDHQEGEGSDHEGQDNH